MEKDEKRIEKFKKLRDEYKKRREEEHQEKFKPQNPYELFGIECREGWKHLYQPIIDYANEHNIEISQVKEKFGLLTIYLEEYDDTVRQMIREAEKKSYNTCEICGKHIDKPISENYWIYAECEDCHNKWKEDREKKLEENYEKIKKIKPIMEK